MQATDFILDEVSNFYSGSLPVPFFTKCLVAKESKKYFAFFRKEIRKPPTVLLYMLVTNC